MEEIMKKLNLAEILCMFGGILFNIGVIGLIAFSFIVKGIESGLTALLVAGVIYFFLGVMEYSNEHKK